MPLATAARKRISPQSDYLRSARIYERSLRKCHLRQLKEFWREGGIEDIKPGTNTAMCHIRPLFTFSDHELFYKTKPFDSRVSDDGAKSVGWSHGLEQNIHMMIGGRHVLVMDNHNFAGAFIWKMEERGVINKGSSMVHIDDHEDILEEPNFSLDEYQGLQGEASKLRYFIMNTNIAAWQVLPLFRSGIIDSDRWSWLSIDGSSWQWKQALWKNRLYEPDGFIKTSGFHDVVDIDIDVLSPLDFWRLPSEKAAILGGAIPSEIENKLIEIADIARRAKVITIATSPGLMVQSRAIVYVKELLRLISSSRQETDRISPS